MLSTFFKSLMVVLLKMIVTLMVLGKLTTLGLLKVKIFRNKCYTTIIFVDDDATTKILSRDSNYIIDVTKVWQLSHFYEKLS